MSGFVGGRAGERGARRHRSWGQRLVLVAGSLTAMAFGGAAVTLGLASNKLEQIPRVELSHVLADDTMAGQARNVLMVGVDSSAGLDEDDPVQNERDPNSMLADTIMVLRLDPASRQAAILSFPRDLLVTFPGTMSQDRINSSIWRGDGSPEVLIELLASNFGIPIHNYVQVDFAGFKDVIETLGGIDVYFENPGRDKHTGLYVYDTGCVHLNADRALAYARSRYYDDYVNGRWRRQLDSDLGRITRQQDVMRRIADKAVDLGVRDAGILYSLAGDAIGSVTVDNSLSLRGIVEVAEQFRSFDPQQTLTYTLPVEPGTLGAMSIVRLKEYEAESILHIFRGDPEAEAADEADVGGEDEDEGEDEADQDSTPGGSDIDPEDLVSPEQIAVAVENGSGVSGQAIEAGDELVAAGFGVISYDNAERFGLERTEIRYPSNRSNEAASLASWLASGAELVQDSSVEGVVLVTGTDWDGVLSEPQLADSQEDESEGGDSEGGDSEGGDSNDDLGPVTSTTIDPAGTTSTSTTVEAPTTTTSTPTTSTTVEPTTEPGPAC